MIAQVAVSDSVYAIDRPYSYRIPDGLMLRSGMRVLVPFGNGEPKKGSRGAGRERGRGSKAQVR